MCEMERPLEFSPVAPSALVVGPTTTSVRASWNHCSRRVIATTVRERAVVQTAAGKSEAAYVYSNGLTPINIRGMELLGFMHQGTIYFCVHQVSVELWKLYDTPRVSIQKKILDLRIKLLNCSRDQIKLLREAGIIENFRATMITLKDTEKLFDALEHSRRSRGLLKHALKTKTAPSQRAERIEEQRARRMSQRASMSMEARRIYQQACVSPSPLHVAGMYQQNPAPRLPAVAGWAPNGVESSADGTGAGSDLELFVTLEAEGEHLVAGKAVKCQADCSNYTEHTIKSEFNHHLFVGGEGSCQPAQDSAASSHSDMSLTDNQCQMVVSNAAPAITSNGTVTSNATVTSSAPLSNVIESCREFVHRSPKSVAGIATPSLSRLGSPVLDSSELEERSSPFSFVSSARSSQGRSTSPAVSLCLELENSGSEESECESEVFYPSSPSEYTPTNVDSDFDYTLRSPLSSVAQGLPAAACAEKASGQERQGIASTSTAAKRRRIPYRLCHLAKTTSPPGTVSSLVVSIPFSMLKNHRQLSSPTSLQRARRGIALSSFVMKKRATNRSSSSSSSASLQNSTDCDHKFSRAALGKPRRVASTLSAKRANRPIKSKLIHRAISKSKGILQLRSDSGATEIEMETETDLFSVSEIGRVPALTLNGPGLLGRVPASSSAPTSLETSSSTLVNGGLRGFHFEKATNVNHATVQYDCASDSQDQRNANRNKVSNTNSSSIGSYNQPHPDSAFHLLQDDDQMSVTSNSTSSTVTSVSSQSSALGACNTNARYLSRQSKNHPSEASDISKDILTLQSSFSFEEYFGFYPPNLVVNGGELQPKSSLSVKHLHRQSLPDNHPVFGWNLGQPVKGVINGSSKRKRKPKCNGAKLSGTSNGEKVNLPPSAPIST